MREFWIAEPTSGDIGICEKGVLWLRLTAKGKLSYGSRPDIGVTRLVSDFITDAETKIPPLQITMEVLNDRAAVGISDTGPMFKRIDAICTRQGLKPSKKGICFYTDTSQIIPVFQKPFVIMGLGNYSLAHQINGCILLEAVVDMGQLYKDYLEAYYFDHNQF